MHASDRTSILNTPNMTTSSNIFFRKEETSAKVNCADAKTSNSEHDKDGTNSNHLFIDDIPVVVPSFLQKLISDNSKRLSSASEPKQIMQLTFDQSVVASYEANPTIKADLPVSSIITSTPRVHLSSDQYREDNCNKENMEQTRCIKAYVKPTTFHGKYFPDIVSTSPEKKAKLDEKDNLPSQSVEDDVFMEETACMKHFVGDQNYVDPSQNNHSRNIASVSPVHLEPKPSDSAFRETITPRSNQTVIYDNDEVEVTNCGNVTNLGQSNKENSAIDVTSTNVHQISTKLSESIGQVKTTNILTARQSTPEASPTSDVTYYGNNDIEITQCVAKVPMQPQPTVETIPKSEVTNYDNNDVEITQCIAKVPMQPQPTLETSPESEVTNYDNYDFEITQCVAKVPMQPQPALETLLKSEVTDYDNNDVEITQCVTKVPVELPNDLVVKNAPILDADAPTSISLASISCPALNQNKQMDVAQNNKAICDDDMQLTLFQQAMPFLSSSDKSASLHQSKLHDVDDITLAISEPLQKLSTTSEVIFSKENVALGSVSKAQVVPSSIFSPVKTKAPPMNKETRDHNTSVVPAKPVCTQSKTEVIKSLSHGRLNHPFLSKSLLLPSHTKADPVEPKEVQSFYEKVHKKPTVTALTYSFSNIFDVEKKVTAKNTSSIDRKPVSARKQADFSPQKPLALASAPVSTHQKSHQEPKASYTSTNNTSKISATVSDHTIILDDDIEITCMSAMPKLERLPQSIDAKPSAKPHSSLKPSFDSESALKYGDSTVELTSHGIGAGERYIDKDKLSSNEDSEEDSSFNINLVKKIDTLSPYSNKNPPSEDKSESGSSKINGTLKQFQKQSVHLASEVSGAAANIDGLSVNTTAVAVTLPLQDKSTKIEISWPNTAQSCSLDGSINVEVDSTSDLPVSILSSNQSNKDLKIESKLDSPMPANLSDTDVVKPLIENLIATKTPDATMRIVKSGDSSITASFPSSPEHSKPIKDNIFSNEALDNISCDLPLEPKSLNITLSQEMFVSPPLKRPSENEDTKSSQPSSKAQISNFPVSDDNASTNATSTKR